MELENVKLFLPKPGILGHFGVLGFAGHRPFMSQLRGRRRAASAPRCTYATVLPWTSHKRFRFQNLDALERLVALGKSRLPPSNKEPVFWSSSWRCVDEPRRNRLIALLCDIGLAAGRIRQARESAQHVAAQHVDIKRTRSPALVRRTTRSLDLGGDSANRVDPTARASAPIKNFTAPETPQSSDTLIMRDRLSVSSASKSHRRKSGT